MKQPVEKINRLLTGAGSAEDVESPIARFFDGEFAVLLGKIARELAGKHAAITALDPNRPVS